MLIKLAALGAAGFVGYQFYRKRRETNEAFAADQAGGPNFAQVRNAGAAATATGDEGKWDAVDEEIDESFPASDPPANY